MIMTCLINMTVAKNLRLLPETVQLMSFISEVQNKLL